jgi:8-oxo-dGTP pyrophosphatase MutT (NUDIX family)
MIDLLFSVRPYASLPHRLDPREHSGDVPTAKVRIVNELTKHIVSVEGVQTSVNRRSKDAATLIVVDHSSATPKIMLGRRHKGQAFLPGKFVFPGGAMDARDRLMRVAAPLHPAVKVKLMLKVVRRSKTIASALALAAIRETFEETGLLLGVRRTDNRPVPKGAWSKFATLGYYPDLSALHLIARAVTPPRYPRRFDTRFFTVDASAIVHRVKDTVRPDAELVELIWVPIDETHRIDMPVITGLVLQDLKARIAAGFARHLPVPYYRMRHKDFVRELL